MRCQPRGLCWSRLWHWLEGFKKLSKGSPEAVLKTSALNRSYSLFALFRVAGEFKRNDKRPGFREGFATPPYGDLSLKPWRANLIDSRLGFQKNFWSECHSAQMRIAALCFKSGDLLSTVHFRLSAKSAVCATSLPTSTHTWKGAEASN